MKTITVFLILLMMLLEVSHAEDPRIPAECEIIVDDFANGIKQEWSTKSFKGQTEYTWMRGEGKPYIRAESSNAASGLVYRIEYDPQKYPYITWNWKVDNIIANGDATRKAGDDYAARIYVVFQSFFFWNTRSLNYIWANKLLKDQAIPNPYTSNAIMISVESGSADTGTWKKETRNVYEDYMHFFGKNPPKVRAIAIMTDTDDTGESTSASYGPIAVCSRDPRK